MVEGYQKPSSVYSVFDRVPLYEVCRGPGDHEAVAYLLHR
jgi:hypothetical protein